MRSVRKYKKKPVVISAMKYDGYNYPEAQDWIAGKGHVWPSWIHNYGPFEIDTLEGKMTVSVGDYIIKGIQGEFYPCKPDIFEQTYESADAPTIPAPRWVRCEERLPEKNGAYAACWLYSEQYYWEKAIFWDGKWKLTNGNGLMEPDYWMPLPEPPREGE